MASSAEALCFEDVTRYTGEPSYQIQAGAACAAAGDFNNDTFLDLFIGYGDEASQCFYNRGFRSFAACEMLRVRPDDIEGADQGQSAAVWADLDGNGSQDLVVALANGDVWVLSTDVGGLQGPRCIQAKAAKDLKCAGPVNVRFSFDNHSFGVRTTGRWAAPAELGVREDGEYRIISGL